MGREHVTRKSKNLFRDGATGLGLARQRDKMADAHLMRTIHPGATGIRAGILQQNPFEVGIESSPITTKDAAVVFSTEMECMNTRSSTIWREHADREAVNQGVWKENYAKFNSTKSRPRVRAAENKGSIARYTIQKHMLDPKQNPLLSTKIPDPLPDKKSLPRDLILNGIFFSNEVKQVPPRLFNHNYNTGCYKPYKATHNSLLPEHNSPFGGHITHQAVQIAPVTQPGGGSIVTIRGTSDLTPTRFCRKNASKAWSEWLAPTGTNNRFTNLQSTTQVNTKDRPAIWKVQPSGRHQARQLMEKASIDRAKRNTHGYKEKVHCGIKILNKDKRPSRPASTMAAASNQQQQATMGSTQPLNDRSQTSLDDRYLQDRGMIKDASGYMYMSSKQNCANFGVH